MGYRTLTPTQYAAEMCLATCNLLGSLLIWIGLALNVEPLIYAGAALYALDILALLFHVNEGDTGRAQQIAYAIAAIQLQLLIGVAAFAALHWDYVLASAQQLMVAAPQERLVLLLEQATPVTAYALYGVLWCKTGLALVFGVFTPLARLLDYETGRARPWVSDNRPRVGVHAGLS
jgi:hypothetical protein